MRAVLIKDGKGSSDALYLGEAERPVPKQGEIIVKVVAFGLNRMDISQREGHYPVPPGTTAIMGVEFSGIVDELGPGVSQNERAVGDEVLGLAYGGAYAEYAAVPVANVIAKPPTMSWVEAAAILENWVTAFQALVHISNISKGDDVLIHAGASGVTVAGIQLAHLYGASKIITTVSSEEKTKFVKSLPNGGPTHAINYKTHDFAEEVKKVTEGKGVEILVDYIGQSYFARNMDSLAKDGQMVLLAFLSGAELPKGVSLAPILFKRLRIQGSTLRSRSPEYQAELLARFNSEVFGHFSKDESSGKEGELKVFIHKVYPWQQIKAAHDEMEGNANSGKIILEVK